MRCRLFILAGAVLAGLGATAASQAAAPARNPYEACLARVQTDPAGALALSESWARTGGGGAADHCAALALAGLGRYPEAAAKLDALARGGFATNPAARMDLYDQAGNAWLLAARPDSAVASFSAALAIDPLDADLLSDRARAFAVKRNWAKAESDLTAALLVSPDRADLYVLRGSARHAQGRKADARIDFDRALKLQPNNPDALVERGTTKFEAGDVAGARADWQQVVTYYPGSAAADTARQHLADSAPATPTRP
ncbi:MAG TPA: tetratricopeptide repeat protein [Rhizomicrobium sp.]|jgi:tetratricopeptide (TPR) repeat protein|nr:tetratricopeptide repeat protein [Rhizomicrobium sp.]